MRLGTRWPFGAEPPASVPADLRGRIAEAESRRTDGSGRHWTLTWLENRPIAELDDGTVVRETGSDAHGSDSHGSDSHDPDDAW